VRQAIVSAAQQVRSGDGTLVIAGGMENMDRAPISLMVGGGIRMGLRQFMTACCVWAGRRVSGKHSGWHTEDLVAKFKLSRQELDDFSVPFSAALLIGAAGQTFQAEIVGVPLKIESALVFEIDEAPRPDTTLEEVGQAKAGISSGGHITAGTRQGLNSGAAALLVPIDPVPKPIRLSPSRDSWRTASHAVEPGILGSGPCRPYKWPLSVRDGDCRCRAI